MSAFYTLGEVCEIARVPRSFVVHCLRAHWVSPAHPEEPRLDEEDLARVRLIVDLVENFGVNHEAVPVILHLLDQLYALRGVGEKNKGPISIEISPSVS